ncbi:MAG: hypothetical protein K2Q09_10080 [Phycisphaerales bacterium]|nr:hypothetical protein [Phycisphaerales bacterium]
MQNKINQSKIKPLRSDQSSEDATSTFALSIIVVLSTSIQKRGHKEERKRGRDRTNEGKERQKKRGEKKRRERVILGLRRRELCVLCFRERPNPSAKAQPMVGAFLMTEKEEINDKKIFILFSQVEQQNYRAQKTPNGTRCFYFILFYFIFSPLFHSLFSTFFKFYFYFILFAVVPESPLHPQGQRGFRPFFSSTQLFQQHQKNGLHRQRS